MTAGVTTFAGRSGSVVPVNTDYGSVGIQQVGTGTLSFLKNTAGIIVIGDTVASAHNFHEIGATGGGGVGHFLGDVDNNQLSSLHLAGPGVQSPGWVMNSKQGVPTGIAMALNATDWTLQIPTVATTSNVAVDFSAASALFNILPNFAATGGFQIAGSFGSAGQCVVSTGTAVGSTH